MKKLNLFVVVASLCVAITVCVACSEIALPDSLAVKVDAPFNFDVEMNMFDLSDKLNKSAIENNVGTGCAVHQYSAGDGIKHYVITFKGPKVRLELKNKLTAIGNILDVNTGLWSSINNRITISDTTFLAPPNPINSTLGLSLNFKDLINTITDNALKSFLNSLELEKINTYLHTSKSAGVLSQIRFEGNIKVGSDYLLGDGSTNKPIIISTSSFDSNKLGNLDTRSDLTKLDGQILADIINGTKTAGNNITLTYQIGDEGKVGSELTITKSDFEKLNGNGNNLDLESTVIVDIPFQLKNNASTAADLNIMQLGGAGQTDILGRGSPNSDFDKFTDVLEYLSLGITPTNQNIFSNDVTISISDPSGQQKAIFSNSGQGQTKQINTKGNFTIQKANIKNLMNTAPYMPDIKLSIPQNGTLSVPEDSVIKMYMSVSTYANGTVKVF